MDINKLLTMYPKTRPNLDDDIVRINEDEYKKNRSGQTAASSLAQKFESWMHKKVSKSFNSICLGLVVLPIFFNKIKLILLLTFFLSFFIK